MDKIDIDPFIQGVVDNSFKVSKDLVRKGEAVSPQVFLLAREHGSHAVLPLIGVEQFFESKEMKRFLRPMIKNVWAKIALEKPWLVLTAVVMISDAWVESIPILEWEKMGRKRKAPFVEKPGMAEALLVQVSLKDKEIAYQWPYVRGEREVVFMGESMAMMYTEGPKALLMGLWPL
jgi:hypothetical protein